MKIPGWKGGSEGRLEGMRGDDGWEGAQEKVYKTLRDAHVAEGFAAVLCGVSKNVESIMKMEY